MDARVEYFPFTQDHAKQFGGHWPTFEHLFEFGECPGNKVLIHMSHCGRPNQPHRRYPHTNIVRNQNVFL